MPKNKTRLNIFLLSCSAFLLVIFTRQEDKSAISTRTRQIANAKLTTIEHLSEFNDNEEHDEDSFAVKEKMNEYTFSSSGINGTKQYHKTSFEAKDKVRAYINRTKINETSHIHTTENSPELDMLGSLSNPYKRINAEDESKMKSIERKLYDEFGFVHKANHFIHYEKEVNKGCDVGKVRKPPEAMIIGVQSCGTERLRSILGAHPKIAPALGEPNFFDKHYNETFSWYLKQMPCSSQEQITIETTPSYFQLADPAGIYTFNPNMKLILCACDPVDRTLSDFIHEQRLGHIKKGRTFEEEVVESDGGIKTNVNITKRSNYLYPLIRYIHYFGLNQIHFIDIEALGTSPWKAFNMLEDFLGIENVFLKTSFWFNTKKNVNCLSPETFNVSILKGLGMEDDGCMKTSELLPKPVIAEALRFKLRKHYTAYCTGFCEIIGNHTCKAFPWSPKRIDNQNRQKIDLVTT